MKTKKITRIINKKKAKNNNKKRKCNKLNYKNIFKKFKVKVIIISKKEKHV